MMESPASMRMPHFAGAALNAGSRVLVKQLATSSGVIPGTSKRINHPRGVFCRVIPVS